MTRHSWIWILLVGFLRTVSSTSGKTSDGVKDCFNNTQAIVVVDKFYQFINAPRHGIRQYGHCIIFVKKNGTDEKLKEGWPQIEQDGGDYLVYLSKWHLNRISTMYILNGSGCGCNTSLNDSTSDTKRCIHGVMQNEPRLMTGGPCKIRCVSPNVCDSSSYDAIQCVEQGNKLKDKYLINMTVENGTCINCDNPVKKPEQIIVMNKTIELDKGGNIDASQAAELVSDMSNFIKTMNGSSAELSVGEGITGVLVKQTEPADIEELSFAYVKPNESINIIQDRNSLDVFSRSVTVPKEAFKKALNTNITEPFAAVFRFINLAKDEKNSTVLGNEVLAVEMGTTIANLTDTINVNFKNIKFKGRASCHSWNGEGGRPNWTDEGCETINDGENITCRCSHLTFFAILMTPLNETISGEDLQNLTIITQVGCGISMFFLCVILFMHFLLRKKKASKATLILIHLVMAMLLLNFSFLVNNYVANLNSDVGCKIMAALMHYFMLATFTWFAVHAFHLCLQLYLGGKIVIRRYILKVSVTSWLLPSVVGIILLVVGKYGQKTIYADKPEHNVAMCWITDSKVHFIVNIGYYVLVFLFTFTTFILILSWLFCLKKIRTPSSQMGQNGRNIITIMGLCCILGITWGCAFFAYGVLQIPAYYVFTILNSFQGLFLFIYYYNSSHAGEAAGLNGSSNLSSSSSSSTLKTALDICENPYENAK